LTIRGGEPILPRTTIGGVVLGEDAVAVEGEVPRGTAANAIGVEEISRRLAD
jgi:hypothetical protein